MEIHVFKKTRKTPRGISAQWNCHFVEPVTERRVQRVCKGCRTRREAIAYARSHFLRETDIKQRGLIRDIAQNMYIPGGVHLQRSAQLGRVLDMRTISANRKLLEEIIKLWGDRELSGITSAEVTAYFFQDEKHSNGVKNTYIQIFSEIYDEAEWQGLRIQKPAFKRFVRHSKKPDIFTTDELNRLFKPENFRDEMSYLFFLLCFSAGLRLGEALAVRPCQILHDRQALIVDGFLRYNHERTNYNKTGTAENNRFRVTMLPKYVLAKLADYIYRRNIQQEALIFTNSAGAPQSSGWAQYVFALALKKAGVDTARRKLCIHALRFTYVTRMRALLPVEIVQRAVGHMSADMTDYYTRPSLEASLKGVEGLEQASEKLFE